MKKALSTTIIILIFYSIGMAAECDEFISWVTPVKDAYQKEHRFSLNPDTRWQTLPVYWRHPVDCSGFISAVMAPPEPITMPYPLIYRWSTWPPRASGAKEMMGFKTVKALNPQQSPMYGTDLSAMAKLMRSHLAEAILAQEKE
jgi:hypothetical protein